MSCEPVRPAKLVEQLGYQPRRLAELLNLSLSA
jgi:hypothetical protein